jgi:Na+(H+)/acetate symporter ActP
MNMNMKVVRRSIAFLVIFAVCIYLMALLIETISDIAVSKTAEYDKRVADCDKKFGILLEIPSLGEVCVGKPMGESRRS